MLGKLCALVDLNFCGGDSAAVDFFYLEAGVEVQRGHGFVEDPGIEAGVDESSEEHVTADAGEAVEVGDAHGGIVSWAAGREGCAGLTVGSSGPGVVLCGRTVTDPTMPCGLRPSGIMGYPCLPAKRF